MKYAVAAMLLLLACPARAAPSDPAVAMAFAKAWVDAETTREFAKEGLALKLQRCVRAGTMTEEQLAVIRPRLDIYLAAFFDGISGVQQKVAEKAAVLLTTADLRQTVTVMSSPLWRQVRSQAISGMAQALVPRIPGCGDESRPIGVSEFGAKALKRLTPAQIKTLRTFAMSPVGQRANRAFEQLVPVMLQAYREDAANAIVVAGGTQEMQEAVRQLPSPITMDSPPPPAP